MLIFLSTMTNVFSKMCFLEISNSRYNRTTYTTAFALVGKDVDVELKVIMRAQLDQHVDKAEKSVIEEINSNPLNLADAIPTGNPLLYIEHRAWVCYMRFIWFTNILNLRIQDFPEEGAPTYYLAHFPNKTHVIEINSVKAAANAPPIRINTH